MVPAWKSEREVTGLSQRCGAVACYAHAQRREMRNKVRELREQRGWSISDLAQRVRIARPTIYGIEAGKTPRLDTAFKIADAFGLPLDDVFIRSRVPDIDAVRPAKTN
jgi:putative transcriptional regulator